MIERFQGEEGLRLLVRELRNQTSVRGDEKLANALAKVVTLQELNEGGVLIEQNSEDTEIYFILYGNFDIKINGRLVAVRESGTHVGEMALLDSAAVRSATVVASKKSVVAKVSEPDFSSIANAHPDLWRQLAIELGKRLRYRNRLVQPPNEIPSVFICSSAENLAIAKGIQLGLEHHSSHVSVWTDQVFGASRQTMEDLERELDQADFAIALCMGEDVVRSRGAQEEAPRDNVIFELGLFMGKLGRKRTFIVCPRNVDLKLPSDLLGLNPISFTLPKDISDARQLATALAPVCTQLMSHFNNKGPR